MHGTSTQGTQNQPVPRIEGIPNGNTTDEDQHRMDAEMLKKVNQQRQAALKNDTDKLLKLATELKTSVDKSSANVLSIDVIKKAEEIEKLAHSVKDKMKGPS
jgi:hypothetical protein